MFRVLLLALIALIVYRLVRARSEPAPRPPTLPEQRMVRCSHCGVFVPETEAASDEGGRPYCSSAHRAAGPRQRGRG